MLKLLQQKRRRDLEGCKIDIGKKRVDRKGPRRDVQGFLTDHVAPVLDKKGIPRRGAKTRKEVKKRMGLI